MTFFAPSNAAFKASGLNTSDVAQVLEVLTYHVAPTLLATSSLSSGSNFVTSSEGRSVRVSRSSDGTLLINGYASVKTADVECSNGVLHVIDSVLVPIPKDIVQTVREWPPLSRLASLLSMPEFADVSGLLRGLGPFTVFAQ